MRLAVDLVDGIVEHELNALLCVPGGRRESEIVGGLAPEEGAQPDPVIGGPRLLGEDGDAEVAIRVTLHELLAEAVPDHSIADYDDSLAHGL